MKLTGNLLIGAQELPATHGTLRALTFVLANALSARGAEIGDGFAERMLVTVGQACLKPAFSLLPEALQTSNPSGIWRLVDGELSLN
jgi:hypothetical protein